MKEVRLYTRTILSDAQVATQGSDGCGAVSQARERAGGLRVEIRAREWLGKDMVAVM